MNLIIALLATFGVAALLLVVFCVGMVYEDNCIANAAKTGQPYKLAGDDGGFVRVTPWEGDGE